MPPYHPEWLVTFWLTTPGLNKLDPHVTLLLIFIVIISFIIIKRRKDKIHIVDGQEEKFQHLLNRKKVIEIEMKDLNTQLQNNRISYEQFSKKKNELERHLQHTLNELKQYTL